MTPHRLFLQFCSVGIYPVRNNAPLLPPGQRPSGPAAAAGLQFRIIPAGFIPFRDKSLTGFNAPLGFESQRLEFLTGFTADEKTAPNEYCNLARPHLMNPTKSNPNPTHLTYEDVTPYATSTRVRHPSAARIIPAGFIPFRDKSLTGFNVPLGFESQRLEFLTGFTYKSLPNLCPHSSLHHRLLPR